MRRTQEITPAKTKPKRARLTTELGVWIYQGAPTKIDINTVVTDGRNSRIQTVWR